MLKKVLGFGLKESGLDTSNFVLSLRLKYINEYISTKVRLQMGPIKAS